MLCGLVEDHFAELKNLINFSQSLVHYIPSNQYTLALYLYLKKENNLHSFFGNGYVKPSLKPQ